MGSYVKKKKNIFCYGVRKRSKITGYLDNLVNNNIDFFHNDIVDVYFDEEEEGLDFKQIGINKTRFMAYDGEDIYE